jgi:hypothetical protein
MCTQYNQLSITSQSAETCGELVKSNDQCKSGHGHFFWGEVNPNHKECACCLGVGEDITDEEMRESVHFNIYKFEEQEEVEVEVDPVVQITLDNKFKVVHKYRECGEQGKNYGPLATPEACSAVALDNGCSNFMFSHEYPVWGCRCCK